MRAAIAPAGALGTKLGCRGLLLDMIANNDHERHGAGSDCTDQIGKVFLVVGQDVRQCLICDGVFTRQAASEHSTVLCMPGISMKTGSK